MLIGWIVSSICPARDKKRRTRNGMERCEYVFVCVCEQARSLHNRLYRVYVARSTRRKQWKSLLSSLHHTSSVTYTRMRGNWGNSLKWREQKGKANDVPVRKKPQVTKFFAPSLFFVYFFFLVFFFKNLPCLARTFGSRGEATKWKERRVGKGRPKQQACIKAKGIYLFLCLRSECLLSRARLTTSGKFLVIFHDNHCLKWGVRWGRANLEKAL